MVTGKLRYGHNIRYFGSDGAMKKGWVKIGNDTYYFKNKDGYMATGKLKIDDKVYEFGDDGKLIA